MLVIVMHIENELEIKRLANSSQDGLNFLSKTTCTIVRRACMNIHDLKLFHCVMYGSTWRLCIIIHG